MNVPPRSIALRTLSTTASARHAEEDRKVARRLRLAVIGVGSTPQARARSWVAAVAKLTEHYDLCAIFDPDPRVAAEVAHGYGVQAHYADLTALLEREKPDVALILVPTDGQAAAAITAAEHGANIITKIPYGITLQIGDAIREACSAKGVKWEIVEQVWLWPQERLKRAICPLRQSKVRPSPVPMARAGSQRRSGEAG